MIRAEVRLIFEQIIAPIAARFFGVDELEFPHMQKATKEAVRQYWAAKEHYENIAAQHEKARDNYVDTFHKAFTALYDDNMQQNKKNWRSVATFEIPTVEEIDRQPH